MNEIVRYILSLRDQFSPVIKTADKNADHFEQNIDGINRKMDRFGSSIRNAFGALAAGFAIKDIIDTTARIDGLRQQLDFANKGVMQTGEGFEYVRKVAMEMGLDINAAADGFSKISGATRGTNLAGRQTQEIFEGIATASSVMHLSAEESSGALRALSQMLSKGKVSAEELNGQLGEHIPGALGIASRAMGVTTAKLMDMMKNSELLSEEFLPRFAAQLKKEFGEGLEESSNSLRANLNRLNTEFTMLKESAGQVLVPALMKLIDVLNKGFDSVQKFMESNKEFINTVMVAAQNIWSGLYPALIGVYGAFNLIWDIIQPVVKFFAEHREIAEALGIALGVLLTGWVLYKTYVMAAAAAQAALNLALAIGAALSGNWAALAVAGTVALTYGIVKATEAQSELNEEMKKAKGPDDWTGSAGSMKNKGFNGKDGKALAASMSTMGSSAKSAEAPRATTINITIGKQIETLVFNTQNLKESVSKVQEELSRALTEVVNNSQIIAR